MIKLRSAEQKIRIFLFVLKVYSVLLQSYICSSHIFSDSSFRIFVVVFSLIAVFNLFCNVSLTAACVTTTVSRKIHVMTALLHDVVFVMY